MVTSINELNDYIVSYNDKYRNDIIVQAHTYEIHDYNSVQFKDELGNNTHFYTCIEAIQCMTDETPLYPETVDHPPEIVQYESN